ncbi:MAG: transposase domain-containing protein [Anaerolineae bacterium]
MQEQGHHKWRKGTILIPKVLVWLVLVLTLRRDLNYGKALNWMLSGLRWLTELLPAHHKIVQDGVISHARVKLGVSVFQVLFTKLVARFRPLPADFHGRSSVVFDGSTGTMPDTEANRDAFGQQCQTLLHVIADCVLARSRRPRCNPRVIKVKMSNWPCKNATHKSETRDIAKELKIIDVQ